MLEWQVMVPALTATRFRRRRRASTGISLRVVSESHGSASPPGVSARSDGTVRGPELACAARRFVEVLVMKTRILIADDDPPLRSLLRLVATRAGFDVDVASNGIEALELIQSKRYTVAVIDLMMPRMSGYELIDHLAGMPSRPAVLVVTALNDPAAARLDSSVVTSILHKPFDIEMLGAVLRDLASTAAQSAADDLNVVDFRRPC